MFNLERIIHASGNLEKGAADKSCAKSRIVPLGVQDSLNAAGYK